jgi:hypothetical protein
MTMCFGGGDSSEKMVKMQEDEAAASRQKEAKRQANIKQGLELIRQRFEGAPVMGSRKVYKGPSTTYANVTTPGKAGGYTESDRGRRVYGAGTPSTTTRKATTTPGGVVTEKYDTGKRKGGFGDDFFNKFRDAITGYYMPDVAEQYGDAKDELTYRLARAGTLRSSGAIGEQADLASQNVKNEAEVRSKADTAVGGLKDRVASERSKAESQLYATEDPNVAANQALAAVENISATKPDLTPLGAIFDIATIGGAGAASGYQNAEYLKKYGLSRTGDASRTIA